MENEESKKKIAIFAVLLLIVIILGVSLFMFKYSTSEPTGISIPTAQTQVAPDVKSAGDLQKLEDEVSNVDIDGLSKDLDLNDQDAATF